MSHGRSRVMLLGAAGQLGSCLRQVLADEFDLVAFDRRRLDLTDTAQLAAAVKQVAPQLIVNAAAYTAVDRAEDDPAACYAVNARVPEVLAQQALACGAALIHYSTDYVYDGSSRRPYVESDPTNPLGVYGRAKLAGDQAVCDARVPALILRTGWVFSDRGHNFYLTMKKLLATRAQVSVVSDQIGAPTSASALADATLELLRQCRRQGLPLPESVASVSGIYHMSCSGQTSWFGFAEAIRRQMQQQSGRGGLAGLTPVSTGDYPTRAARPAYSVLDNGRLHRVFGIRLPSWSAALDEYAVAGRDKNPL